MKVVVYRFECEVDEVVWRGPAEDDRCWHCGRVGRAVCQVAEMVWSEPAA
jgi:hypothetical protein